MKTTVNEAENEDDGATTYIVLGISNNDMEKKNMNVSILRNHDHRKKFLTKILKILHINKFEDRKEMKKEICILLQMKYFIIL